MNANSCTAVQNYSYFTTINIVWRCERASATSSTVRVTQLNHKRATSHTSCLGSEAFFCWGERRGTKKIRPRRHAGFTQGELQPRRRTTLPPAACVLLRRCAQLIVSHYISMLLGRRAQPLKKRQRGAGLPYHKEQDKSLRKAKGAGGDLVWCERVCLCACQMFPRRTRSRTALCEARVADAAWSVFLCRETSLLAGESFGSQESWLAAGSRGSRSGRSSQWQVWSWRCQSQTN